jgi:hypothetical protein
MIWKHCLPLDPSTTAPPFGKCRSGQICRICLESGGKQCFQIMYRGAGPPPKTFDFTPNFYQTACAGTPPQPELARKCETLRTAAAALVGRQNCIADPGHALCTELIQSAAARRSADRAEFEQCVASGEQEYNKRKPPPQQRALGCAYEKTGTGGPNSKGKTWRKLLPGACRDGTFVGRDGLDCCSGITLNDGPLGSECRAFYPRPPG